MAPVLGPAGWFPDPAGQPHLRWFDGERWTDWVSGGGQVFAAPLPPPPTGGGTLVTEPVLLTAAIADGFEVTTPAGTTLALAGPADDSGRRLAVAHPSGRVIVELSRSGLSTAAAVTARMVDAGELGRYEAAGAAVRVLSRGALVAVVRPPDVVDPANAPLARISANDSGWTTELARPLGDPLHPLLALAGLALFLLER